MALSYNISVRKDCDRGTALLLWSCRAHVNAWSHHQCLSESVALLRQKVPISSLTDVCAVNEQCCIL